MDRINMVKLPVVMDPRLGLKGVRALPLERARLELELYSYSYTIHTIQERARRWGGSSPRR